MSPQPWIWMAYAVVSYQLGGIYCDFYGHKCLQGSPSTIHGACSLRTNSIWLPLDRLEGFCSSFKNTHDSLKGEVVLSFFSLSLFPFQLLYLFCRSLEPPSVLRNPKPYCNFKPHVIFSGLLFFFIRTVRTVCCYVLSPHQTAYHKRALVPRLSCLHLLK